MKTCEHHKQTKGPLYATKDGWVCELCYFHTNKTS